MESNTHVRRSTILPLAFESGIGVAFACSLPLASLTSSFCRLMKHLRARAIRARGEFDFHSALHCFHPPCHRHRLGQKYLETRTPFWRSRQVFSGTILQHPRGRREGEDREEEYFQFPACPVGNERTPRIRSRDRMLDTINNLLLITRASFELQISSAIREKRTA